MIRQAMYRRKASDDGEAGLGVAGLVVGLMGEGR